MAALQLLLLVFLHLSTAAYSIGVNYGTLADNLPPPSQVADFLKSQTIIDAVKIFDVNPDIIKAFAHTNISLTITIPNGDIPNLAGNLAAAKLYLTNHILPFYPATKLKYILMGNEILHWGDDAQKNGLVPAMRTLQIALNEAGIKDVRVSTPHSLGIMLASEPASSGRFRPEIIPILLDQLKFCRETKSPLIFNPYPFFGWSPEKENFALFRPNRGIFDNFTKKMYTNMFDNLMDAVFSACKALGFADVEFVAAETGWPSKCEYPVCSVQNAMDYNGKLISHVGSGKGTPLMPGRRFETYIFALFNENQKPGPMAEQNWGLFRPDFSPVYNAGVLRSEQGGVLPGKPAGPAVPTKPGRHPGRRGKVAPKPVTPVVAGAKWCVAKPGTSPRALQANINYVCSTKVDCRPIQPGGACASSDLAGKASFLMNAYYQANGRNDFNCDFTGSGQITTVNPSREACSFIA